METLQYSNKIEIRGWAGKSITEGAAMERKRGAKFIDHVKDALKKLKKLKTGMKLLEEINTSAHTCVIFCSGLNNQDKEFDGCAQTNPTPSYGAMDNAMIRTFRPRFKNMPQVWRATSPNFVTPQNPKGRGVEEVSWREGFRQLVGHKETRGEKAPELINIMNRARTKHADPWRICEQVTGKSREQLNLMAIGELPIDDNTYYKICIFFYPFLQPGPGTSTQVRLQFAVALTGDVEIKGGKDYKHDQHAVRADIMLGHELIHAWRMMTGRRIVIQGWEEEAMTVGLAFAAGWPMTENQLRVEAGHPRRNRYKGMVPFNSDWAIYNAASNNQ
jgi:hypothetical protein